MVKDPVVDVNYLINNKY